MIVEELVEAGRPSLVPRLSPRFVEARGEPGNDARGGLGRKLVFSNNLTSDTALTKF